MNVVVYAPILFQGPALTASNFIVETFLCLVQQKSDISFFIITEDNKKVNGEMEFGSNITIITTKPSLKNILLRKIWWDVKLPGILRKHKAAVFISFENRCSLKVSLPQIIAFSEIEKIKPAYLKKAQLVFVPSKKSKDSLEAKYKLKEGHAVPLYPSANNAHLSLSETEKKVIKNKFSEGKEYFLYSSFSLKNENFIDLLKAFSHFKKRQQSNFKLLLLTTSWLQFEKDLATYKYRSDVNVLDLYDKNDLAQITAAAYAVVLPFNDPNDGAAALKAMQSGSPVIISNNSVIHEIAADAALFTETATTKELGEKMMQLYTNENSRAALIEKGKVVSAKFTSEKATDIMWQSILELVK